ncbi:MAG: redoxin domain-containing protein [Woeseiaceae bacterium]
MLSNLSIVVIVTASVLAGGWFWLKKRGLRRMPAILKPGSSWPDFHACDEQGAPVRSAMLRGAPAVILFVRGNWCPFCSTQVKDLTSYYKDILDLGARLILITPKPLETTRRVAGFFDVKFEFWLDEDLEVAKRLGLLHVAGVPKSYGKEYGRDTVWPTALVVDAAGIIRYTALSKHISDRPDPELLLRELRKAIKT